MRKFILITMFACFLFIHLNSTLKASNFDDVEKTRGCNDKAKVIPFNMDESFQFGSEVENLVNQKTPSLCMFAGPNGSGKSTLIMTISPVLLGIFINPDTIESKIRHQRCLDFQSYGVRATDEEVMSFFANSSLLEKAGMLDKVQDLLFVDNKLIFCEDHANAYFASVVADFIRNKLLEAGKSFSFETVMSIPDKIEFLRRAQEKGYFTYLYYIATEDPNINIFRVRDRVKEGGHSVPDNDVIKRYERSLDLLIQAVQCSNHSYIFDNSGHEIILIAEVINGRILEMKTNQMPIWFKKALWDKFYIEIAIDSNKCFR